MEQQPLGARSPRERLTAETWLAHIKAARSEIAEADRLLDELVPTVAQVSNPGDETLFWWARAAVALAAGRFEESYDAAIRAAEGYPTDADFSNAAAPGADCRSG